MSIREYSDDDFKAVQDIYLLCKPEEFSNEKVHVDIIPLAEDRKRLDEFNLSTVFVSEKDSVVGFVTVLNNQIGWLYVHPEFRKQNIGKQLLSFVLDFLKNQTVTLNTTKSNFPALLLYKKFRFSTVKEFVVSVNGVDIEVCQLSRT